MDPRELVAAVTGHATQVAAQPAPAAGDDAGGVRAPAGLVVVSAARRPAAAGRRNGDFESPVAKREISVATGLSGLGSCQVAQPYAGAKPVADDSFGEGRAATWTIATELVDVIRRVRNRWRLRLAPAGRGRRRRRHGARAAAVGLRPRIVPVQRSGRSSRSASSRSPCSSGCSSYGFVWPLRRQVTDAQVAMYLEECDPTLEAAILSAVEATADGGIRGALAAAGREARRAGDRAVPRGRATARRSSARGAASRRDARRRRRGRRAHRRLGPAYLRHGLSALLVISRSAEASSPYSIEVTPGQHQGAARRGSDGEREARRLHRRRRQRDDAHGAERARSSACRSSPPPIRHLRRHAVPPREGDRVLRRVERRALDAPSR